MGIPISGTLNAVIINLTILECKLKGLYDIQNSKTHNKSNHIGM